MKTFRRMRSHEDLYKRSSYNQNSDEELHMSNLFKKDSLFSYSNNYHGNDFKRLKNYFYHN